MKLKALMKKEFHRFFHDPRLIVTMLLPGLLIFLLYTILGETVAAPATYDLKVYVRGESEICAAIGEAASKAGNGIEWLTAEDDAAAREAVEQGEAAAFLIFTDGFDSFAEGSAVSIVYDPMDGASNYFYALSVALLQQYGMRFAIVPLSLASEEAVGMEVMQTILPFILVCFIFSACMSVTLESVAGEKERGTLATVLVTSAKRSSIALGKILPLSCISMLGALSSFLGVALSMPKLMGVSMGFLGGYSVWHYLLLFLLIVSVVPLIVALISTVSTFARSVKEASAYTGILMIFVMVLSLVTAFLPAIGGWAVAIPVLNAVVSMQGLLSGELTVWQPLVSVAANLFYTALLVYVMTKMLSSEKVMFGR